MIKYSTISLPKELYDKLQEILEENPDMGYSSVADFCKEAIRLHVQEIKRELREDFLRSVDVPLLVKKIQSISAADKGTYGKIFEKMNCIAFLFSSSYKMKYCNKEFLDHFGYSRIEDVVGRDVSKFFEDKNLQKKIKRGGLRNEEVKAVRRDGKKIDLLLDVTKINNNMYVGTAKDVTVKNYLIERERRLRELYEQLINELFDSIMVVQDEKIKFVNRRITVTGYKAEDVLGKHYLDFVPEEDKKRLADAYEKMLKGKIEMKPRKYKAIFSDGSIREVELMSKKIKYEGKDALLVVVRAIGKKVNRGKK